MISTINIINGDITRFILQQTCATICCIDEHNIPYCFNCYYVVNPVEGLLFFKSSEQAHNSSLLAINPFVTGTILRDKLNKLLTKGIQWRGKLVEENHSQNKDASEYYHKINPLALAKNGKVFTICLDSIKMTDSTFGFGKINIWEKDE